MESSGISVSTSSKSVVQPNPSPPTQVLILIHNNVLYSADIKCNDTGYFVIFTCVLIVQVPAKKSRAVMLNFGRHLAMLEEVFIYTYDYIDNILNAII